ncbi:MAG TPA: C-type lectin domain-containing protein [Kofleriaceae bacterium]|nr:C-type lectin domain-containing protein [Kofleriaceae bacterium]
MRATLAMVLLVGACRFEPTGGARAGDDDGPPSPVDAAELDGSPVDARAIDAAAIDAQLVDAPGGPCPGNYDIAFNGEFYAFRPVAMQYAQAKADCADDLAGRTHLATFELAAIMNAAIGDVNPGDQATPWVGAECITGLDCSFTLSWLWITGFPVSSTLWDSMQPHHSETERVARAERNNDGVWQLANVDATATLPYICECDQLP